MVFMDTVKMNITYAELPVCKRFRTSKTLYDVTDFSPPGHAWTHILVLNLSGKFINDVYPLYVPQLTESVKLSRFILNWLWVLSLNFPVAFPFVQVKTVRIPTDSSLQYMCRFKICR